MAAQVARTPRALASVEPAVTPEKVEERVETLREVTARHRELADASSQLGTLLFLRQESRSARDALERALAASKSDYAEEAARLLADSDTWS